MYDISALKDSQSLSIFSHRYVVENNFGNDYSIPLKEESIL